MKRLTIILTLFLMIGCAGQQIKPSVCDTMPTDSYSVICEVAHYLKMEPEDMDKAMIIGVAAGIIIDKDVAQQAKDFIDDFRVYLSRAQRGYGLLYSTMFEFVDEEYNSLPEKVQLAIIILEQFGDIDLSVIPNGLRVLSDYDFEMLYNHLDKLDAILAPLLE